MNRTTRPRGGAPPKWLRAVDVGLGLASVTISIIILANLNYQFAQLVLLLSVSLILNAARMTATGGVWRTLDRLQSLGLVGGGLLAGVVAVAVLLLPGLSLETLVYLFAIVLTIQGLGRISRYFVRGPPFWLRTSTLAVGVATVSMAVIAVFIPGIAALALVPMIATILLVNGVEMVVWGLSPTDPRQVTLLKLILFSAFYGLILINWLDLYGTTAPAYHVWLIMTYMAPFGVLIVFQGLKDWQVAVSLGLLVSLMNDLGYYFIGDLLFGFHRALLPWLEGQLGFLGAKVLFDFQGGVFQLPVTSILMGLTVYVRIAVVTIVLYDWWKHPAKY